MLVTGGAECDRASDLAVEIVDEQVQVRLHLLRVRPLCRFPVRLRDRLVMSSLGLTRDAFASS